MKVVVTGGTGFMGSHFVKLVSNCSHDVTVLSKRTGVSTLESLKDILPQIQIQDLDLQDYSKLCRQVLDADIVVHYAAESHVTKSIENPEPFIRTNVLGTMNLLNACMDMGVSKFILISSCEAYGESGDSTQSEDRSPLRPKSPYAASKAAQDCLAQSYIYTYDYPIVIFRPCNNFGPWQHEEKAIPRFIWQAMHDQPLTIHGTGQQMREWIYTEDCAEAVSYGISLAPGVYNIGSGAVHTLLHIAESVRQLVPESKSEIIHVGDRDGQVVKFQLARDKLYNMTGWLAKYSFLDGMKKTVDWYRDYYGKNT